MADTLSLESNQQREMHRHDQARSSPCIAVVIQADVDSSACAQRVSLLRQALPQDIHVLMVTTSNQLQVPETGKNAGSITVMRLANELAYGDRQKLILEYAQQNKVDVLLLTPIDHDCDLSAASRLLDGILNGNADLVLGSRFAAGDAASRKSFGWWRSFGNRLSSRLNSWLMGVQRSDVHSAYRAIRVSALKDIPFQQNSPDRRFDMDLLIQFHTFGRQVVDVPVASKPGGATGFLEGFSTGLAAVRSGARYFLHHKGFLYHPLFDNKRVPYRLRTDPHSVHHWIVQTIPSGARVLDLGCSDGYVARLLRQKGCRVVGVDIFDSTSARADTDEFFIGNLEDLRTVAKAVDFSRFDYAIALDVIEHLADPEDFLRTLRANIRPGCQVILSTANVAYWVVRFMLLLGQFNYGKRGILDITHKRLFTRATFARSCRVTGFQVKRVMGVPPPVHYVIPGHGGELLTGMHAGISRFWPSLFGFQIIVQIVPRITTEQAWKLVSLENAS